MKLMKCIHFKKNYVKFAQTKVIFNHCSFKKISTFKFTYTYKYKK